MRPLNATRPDPHDPAPSIWSYRFQRLWLTPFFRRLVRVGVPAFFAIVALGWFISDEEQVQSMSDSLAEMRREIEGRPEFLVNVMGIEGTSPDLAENIRTVLSIDFPVSSFDLNLVEMKQRIEEIPAVLHSELRVQSGGYLSVVVEERVPLLIWQRRDAIVLLDREGEFVADITERGFDEPMPMVAGEGADLAVEEALALFAAAAPISERLQGLVRMGERRWDVVMSDGLRILLPEEDPVRTLDRVLALHDMQDVLDRDVLRIDMRHPERPSLQLTPDAITELHRMRGTAIVNGDQNG